MPKYASLEQAIHFNQKQPCKVTGCTRLRRNISSMCGSHTTINNVYGDPENQNLRPPDYSRYQEPVKKIILDNLGHPGVILGLSFFKEWLDNPLHPKHPQIFPELIFEVADAGVSDVELLSMSAAIFMLRCDDYHKIKSFKHFIYQLGGAIIRTVPRRRKYISGTARREYGQYVYDNLKRLFLTIRLEIERKKQEDEAKEQAFSEPLVMV